MKVKVSRVSTSIECTADELRQSNTLADSFTNVLRSVFIGKTESADADDEEEDTDED